MLRRYSRRCGSFLILVKRALSTAFWSLARALATFFFYERKSIQFASSFVLQPTCGIMRQLLTSGFSPCLKKASSPLLSCFFSLVKYPSSATFSTVFSSTPLSSTFPEVAITYRALTLRNGTPLTLNGPVTRSTPCERCLSRTTRLPRKRPARRMRIAPGWSVARGLAGFMDLRTCRNERSARIRVVIWVCHADS